MDWKDLLHLIRINIEKQRRAKVARIIADSQRLERYTHRSQLATMRAIEKKSSELKCDIETKARTRVTYQTKRS